MTREELIAKVEGPTADSTEAELDWITSRAGPARAVGIPVREVSDG